MRGEKKIEIKTVIDGLNYELHGLNCFTVPKCIASEAFHPQGRYLANAYLYAFSHYDLLGWKDQLVPSIVEAYDFPATGWYRLEQYVFENKLGLRIEEEPCAGNLRTRAGELLENGWPVLVPVDKSELFYTAEYHRKSSPHLIVINGCDPARGLYHVISPEQNLPLWAGLDARHHPWGDLWSDFRLPFDLLEKANEAYVKNYQVLRGSLQFLRPHREVPADAKQILWTDLASRLPAAGSIEACLEPKARALRRLPAKEQLRFVNTQHILGCSLCALIPEADPQHERKQQDVRRACQDSLAAWKILVTADSVMDRLGTRDEEKLKTQWRAVVACEQKFIEVLKNLPAGSRPAIAAPARPETARPAAPGWAEADLLAMEEALRRDAAIADCAIRPDREDERKLRLFVTGDRGTLPPPDALERVLATRLGGPVSIVDIHTVPQIPRSLNGAIDRDSLTLFERKRLAPASGPVTFDNPTEQVLHGIWQELLGISAFGLDDDWFEVGGHSLLAVQLVACIRETFGVDVPLRVILETPTIRGLSGFVIDAVLAQMEEAPAAPR